MTKSVGDHKAPETSEWSREGGHYGDSWTVTFFFHERIFETMEMFSFVSSGVWKSKGDMCTMEKW